MLLTIALTVFSVLMIVLEKTKVIDITKKPAGIFTVFSLGAVAGLYFTEAARLIVAAAVKLSGYTFGNSGEKNELIFGSMSKAGLIIRLVLVTVCIVPCAANIIYMVQALIRRPVRQDYVGRTHSVMCAQRTAELGIAAVIFTYISLVVMVIGIIPYLDELVDTFIMFPPLLLLIFTILTLGIALIPLVSVMISLNAYLILIVSGLSTAGIAFWAVSAALGIASAVRGGKCGAFTKGKAAAFGVLSVIPVWNIVSLILMKKELKKS